MNLLPNVLRVVFLGCMQSIVPHPQKLHFTCTPLALFPMNSNHIPVTTSIPYICLHLCLPPFLLDSSFRRIFSRHTALNSRLCRLFLRLPIPYNIHIVPRRNPSVWWKRKFQLESLSHTHTTLPPKKHDAFVSRFSLSGRKDEFSTLRVCHGWGRWITKGRKKERDILHLCLAASDYIVRQN